MTGSEKAGAAVASAAAREIKKSVLELGGSDAFIVMPSADFESALSTAVKARTINTGQSCIAAKRFIIADEIYEQFLQQFVERMRALKVGDPMDPETELGPLATEQILQGVDDQVQKTIAAGAKLLTGGNRIHGPGFFYEPTVLVDVPKESPAYREEIFGPVAAVFRVGDADAAVELANDTRFGLGSSAWTKDRKEQKLFASELDSRNGFHQRDGRVRSAFAIRRRKTFRLWPRTRRRRDSRIHEHEDDLDFLNEWRASTSLISAPGQSEIFCEAKAVSLVTKRFVKLVGIFSDKPCVQSDAPDSSLGEIFLCSCNQRATNSAATHRTHYHQGNNSPGEIVMLDAWISQCADHPAHFAITHRHKCAKALIGSDPL